MIAEYHCESAHLPSIPMPQIKTKYVGHRSPFSAIYLNEAPSCSGSLIGLYGRLNHVAKCKLIFILVPERQWNPIPVCVRLGAAFSTHSA